MIVVIGAGPAGLSAAHHLRSEHLVLEREPEPGGLCASFELGGVVFDLGGHAFFTRHDHVRDLVAGVCPTGLHTQPRRAYVHTHGRFVPYPFQAHLHGLPPDVVRECLLGVFEAAASADPDPPRHLADWIVRRFGVGIAQRFLLPYNRKLWGFPLDEISPDWTSGADRRVAAPDVAAIVAGALQDVSFTDVPNAQVGYPKAGGFANLYSGLASGVGDRLVQAAVESVDLGLQVVTSADGRRFSYDALISTMPLDQLVDRCLDAPACCRQAAAALRHNSLLLVNLVIDRPAITDMQRVYSADPEVPFHKLVLNSNSSPDLRSRPRFGIQAEVSFTPHKPVERKGLERLVLDAVVGMGIVATDDVVVASSVVPVRYAYPVYTHATAQARSHLLSAFAHRGVFCAGRFGEWLYINSDDAVMRGKESAEQAEAWVAGT